MKKYLFLIALLLSAPFALNASITIYEFDSPEQELLFKQLGKELRCPKCQNNNIADSNAALAQDLRDKVYEMLKSGKSEDDIVDYMVARYGNFVTYNPPLSASTVVLWVGPFVLILVGFALLLQISRKKTNRTNALSADEKARLAKLLGENKDVNP